MDRRLGAVLGGGIVGRRLRTVWGGGGGSGQKTWGSVVGGVVDRRLVAVLWVG